MKKMKQVIYILVICFLYIRNCYAFVLPDYTPLIPMAPQICAQCTPAAITNVMSKIEMVLAIKEDFESGKLLSQVEQMAKSYAMQLGSTAFNHLKKDLLKRKKVVSYARTIEECDIGGDMTDETTVKEAFIKLFLQYPSDKGPWKKAYENKVNQMKMDTNVEMYITAVEMSKELDEMVAELDNIEKCIVAGEDCSSAGMESYNCQSGDKEDDACLWRNALMAVRIYDKIMQYNEFLLAMKTQLDAVSAIGNNVKIREYKKEEEEKTSFLNEQYKNQNIQVATLEHKSSSIYASATKNKFGFSVLKTAGLKSPLEGKKDDFASLTVVKNAQDKINEAITYHNFKRMLPDYREAFEKYHTFNRYYQTALEKVYMSETCAINHIDKFYIDGLKAWLGDNCKKVGNSFECEYKEQDEERKGEHNVACSDNPDKTCFVLSQEDFNGRSGISAWLIKLYEEANIQENNSDEDIYMTMSSSGDGEMQSLSNSKKNANSKYKDDSSGSGEPNLKKPSLEEDMYAEMRKNSLLSWTLGAKVSQEVAKDMVSSEPKFGGTKSLPLWNDQKAFYDLYLEGKYQNIREYIENTPLFSEMSTFALAISDMKFMDAIDENGNIVVDRKADREASRKSIQKFQEILSDKGNSIDTSKVDKLLQEEEEALNTIYDNYLKQIQVYEDKKNKIYTQLDEVSEDLTKVRDEMKQAVDDEKQGDSLSMLGDTGEFVGKTFQRGKLLSPIDKFFNEKKTDGDSLRLSGKSKKESGKILEKRLTKEIKELRKELEKINEALQEMDGVYVKNYSDKEFEYKQKIAEAVDGATEKDANIIDIITSNSPLKISETITDMIRQYALGVIDETENKINNLKTNNRLYYAANSTELQAIHKEMIDKLKNITLSELIAKVAFPSVIDGITITEQLFAPFQSVFAKVLDGKDVPDTEYFVGLIAKERDLMAPKAPVDFQSASLRDVFHMDQDDFFSIKQYYKGNKDELPKDNKKVTITKKAILDSGLELPEIWKYILKRRAFVEKDIDMEKLLNRGTPGLALVNRGLYPCRDEATGQSIAMSGLEDFVVVPQNSEQVCQHIKIKDNMIHSTEVDAQYKYKPGSLSMDEETSELGQVFEYIKIYKTVCTSTSLGLPLCNQVLEEEKLTFRQELQEAVYVLVDLLDSKKSDEEEEKLRVLYNSVLFERNQFGDFLDMVQQAKSAKEIRDAIENSLLEVKAQLKSMFEEIGFTFSDDFDLSIDADYKEAEEILDAQKEGYINAARKTMNGIKGISSRVASDKNKLKKQIELLEKDKNEFIAISGTEDVDDFEEALRTEMANREVVKEYRKEGDDSINNNLKRLRPPYCSVY